jgi:hypothetical protein
MTSRSIYDEPRRLEAADVSGSSATSFRRSTRRISSSIDCLPSEESCRRSVPCFARAAIYGLPTMGASCRCSGRLINDIHPGFQAWRTLDLSAAAAATYQLAPLSSNPYRAAIAKVPPPAAKQSGSFPQLNAMLVSGTLSSVMETLDHWQRNDPLDEYLRTNAPTDFDPVTTPCEPYPVDPRCDCFESRRGEQSQHRRCGWVPVRLLVPRSVNSAALQKDLSRDSKCPFSRWHCWIPPCSPTRKTRRGRLLDELAGAAVCAEDDEPYAEAYGKYAAKVVGAIRAEFVMDLDIFAYACEVLQKFSDQWQQRTAQTIQPQVDAGLAAETRDADRSRVRVLIRDKLSGINVPFDIRTFVGTIWADYMTSVRLAEGVTSDAYAASAKVMDDMLWSITAKRRTGQKARLSVMIPPMVRGLRAGAAKVKVSEEQIGPLPRCAVQPAHGGDQSGRGHGCASASGSRVVGNVVGAQADREFARLRRGSRPGDLARVQSGRNHRQVAASADQSLARYLHLRQSLRVGPEGVHAEELAWEMSTGRVTLIQEPVPLFERAMSATLEYLVGQKARQDATNSQTVEKAPPGLADNASFARA